jgi:NAD(P)-dependent dehydrogenase (short-subunit alcohol dehydrogenase family)
MKIVVLGATGGIGVELIRQSIDRGHTATAFVRSAGPLETFAGRINVVEGDVLNRAELERVLAGQEAVVSGFGPRVPISKDDAHLLQQFGNVVTSAMRHAGVQRIVAVSVAFLFKDSIIPPAYLAGRRSSAIWFTMQRKWRMPSNEAGLTGRSCGRPDSLTNPTPESIVCRKVTCRGSASPSHAPM